MYGALIINQIIDNAITAGRELDQCLLLGEICSVATHDKIPALSTARTISARLNSTLNTQTMPVDTLEADSRTHTLDSPFAILSVL